MYSIFSVDFISLTEKPDIIKWKIEKLKIKNVNSSENVKYIKEMDSRIHSRKKWFFTIIREGETITLVGVSSQYTIINTHHLIGLQWSWV